MVGIWEINIVLGGVGIALLLALLYVYARNLREIRTPFGLGLLVFALLFLLENVVSIITYFAWWGIHGADIALPMMYIRVAEVAAFGVLLAISWG